MTLKFSHHELHLVCQRFVGFQDVTLMSALWIHWHNIQRQAVRVSNVAATPNDQTTHPKRRIHDNWCVDDFFTAWQQQQMKPFNVQIKESLIAAMSSGFKRNFWGSVNITMIFVMSKCCGESAELLTLSTCRKKAKLRRRACLCVS